MRFRWKGDRELLANVRRVAQRAPDVVMAAMYIEAEIDMTESKRRVPVEHGVLRASGHVSPPQRRGRTLSVEMGYGGAAEDYAIPQHERLDFKHPRGGQAKYLESVINESRSTILGRIAGRIDFERMLR